VLSTFPPTFVVVSLELFQILICIQVNTFSFNFIPNILLSAIMLFPLHTSREVQICRLIDIYLFILV